MATRTFWACSCLTLALFFPQGCRRQTPSLSLQEALKVAAGPKEKAKALLAVAFATAGTTHKEAFYLAALYACDGGSPVSALRAFAAAKPEGGRTYLALRRLEQACRQKPLPAAIIKGFAHLPWVGSAGAVRLALASAETAWQRGERQEFQALLELAQVLSGGNLPALRVLRASARPEEAHLQQQQLLLQRPDLLVEAFPHVQLEVLTREFGKDQWRQLAQAWLAVDQPERALKAAQKAGNEAADVAAEACLRLRRSRQAEAWAQRLSPRSPKRYLLLAQAFRQQAWDVQGVDRIRFFSRAQVVAQRAAELAEGRDRAEALVLWAEALVEQGTFRDVSQLLTEAVTERPPRWEWVTRRALFTAARKGTTLTLPLEAGGQRLERIGQFWRAYLAWRRGDGTDLKKLAASGHPDLAALWSARLLREPLRWRPGEGTMEAPPPPSWSKWLLAAGRVADVVMGWRAELEAAKTKGPEWLGVLQLGKLPPLESIPLLVRAEPRLLSGPWEGVSRELLRQYLPLPFAQEIAQAAKTSGVPPWVLAAVVRQESAFNPQARSSKGAVGLAQLLPRTAGLSANALLSPAENLQAGAKHLARLRASFQGAWEPTLAAYNAGEARIRRQWDRVGRKEGAFFVESLELPETWDYVHRVMLFAQGYRALYWPDAPQNGDGEDG